MQIVCPKCQFAREIPDDKVPANAKVATCPKCKIKFQFRDLPDEAPQLASPPPQRPVPAAAPAPPLPGSRQQLAASRVALKTPAAPGEPGEGIWNRLEAMPPEATPPAFDPDAPSAASSRPQPPQHPRAGGTPGFAAPQHRLVKNPLEEAAEAGQASDDPELLRYTRSREAGLPGGAGRFAQPSYFREHPGQGERTGQVPWEHMREYGGFLPATFKTIKAVMLSPVRFFSEMPIGAGIGKPMGFAMLLGTLNALFGFGYQMLGLSLQPDMFAAGGMNNLVMGMGIGMVVATPLFLAIALVINAFLVTMALRLLKAAHAGFEGTFRALAYGFAVGILGIIPILGPIVGGLWAFILMFISLKHVHDTSYGKVILSMILMGVILFLLVFGLVFALGMGLAMLGGGS